MTSSLGLATNPRAGGEPRYQLDVGRVISQSFSITVHNRPPFGLVGLVCYLPVSVRPGDPRPGAAAAAEALIAGDAGGGPRRAWRRSCSPAR
jgi:hypothetical protein